MWALDSLVNTTRFQFMSKYSGCKAGQDKAIITDEDIEAQISYMENKLQLKPDYELNADVSAQTLKTAGEMFVYLTFCPPKEEMNEATNQVKRSFKPFSPKEILVILSRMNHANSVNLPFQNKIFNVLKKLRMAWNPHFEQIKKQNGALNTHLTPIKTKFAGQINHPVHILDENTVTSPSSFIPFCFFGKWNSIGKKLDPFTSPICTYFKPKLRNDQICYEMNLNDLIKNNNHKEDLMKGLYFIIDENVDRRMDLGKGETRVYLDTIGNLLSDITLK